jgi:hypothetical protein
MHWLSFSVLLVVFEPSQDPKQDLLQIYLTEGLCDRNFIF